jgi:energy-coupling factor transporter ATP-binding protein EcfA2
MDYQLNKAIAQEEQLKEAAENKDFVVSDYKDEIYRYTTDSRDPMRYGVDYAETLARASGQAFQTQGPLSSYVRDPSWWDKAVSKVTGEVFGDVNKPFVIDPVKGIIAEITDDHEIIDGLSQIFSAVTGIGLTLETAEAIATDGSGQMYSYRGMEGTVPSVLANIFGVDQYTLRTQEEQAAIDEKAREAAAAQSSDSGTSSAYVAPVTTSAQTATNRSASAYLNPTVNTAVSPTRVSFSTDYTEQTPYVNPYFRLYSSRGFRNAAYGGEIQKMAEGGVVQEQAPQEQVTGPAGFVGQNPEQVAESQTVADDVAMEVPEGTFVLNAAAVEFAGSADIKKMLVNAMGEAKRQGLDISTNDNTMSNDDAVSLLVSQGEVVIPPQLAKIIGYDKLNKINNRGVKETEQRLEEQQAQQQPDQQMACGGFAKKRAKGSEGTGETRSDEEPGFLRKAAKWYLGENADDVMDLTPARLYFEFMEGRKDPITNADFTDDELKTIGNMLAEQKNENATWEKGLRDLHSTGFPFYTQPDGQGGTRYFNTEDEEIVFDAGEPTLTDVENAMFDLENKIKTFDDTRGRTSIRGYDESVDTLEDDEAEMLRKMREDPRFRVGVSLGQFTGVDNPDGSVTISTDKSGESYGFNDNDNFNWLGTLRSDRMKAEAAAKLWRPGEERPVNLTIPAEYLK